MACNEEKELPVSGNNKLKMRSQQGGILPLMLALLIGILILFAVFSWQFTAMLGSHQEQTTAIQAASLAAARAIGRVVVNDPQLGYISITDSAPRGQGIVAGDGYAVPVRSYNAVLATIRLDMIIADAINDPVMKQFAANDHQVLMQAKDRLIQAVFRCASGILQVDRDGNDVDAVAEAIDAYRANVIRMGGNGATLIPGSLKITLGTVPGARTNMQIPQPTSFASTPAADQENNFYRAYRNIPYGGKDFVFSAVHDSIILVDPAKFVANPSLPYFVPSIVKVEADEQYQGSNVPGTPGQHVVHAVSCAQCGTPPDPRCAAGALLISFPDGKLGEIAKPADIRTDPKLNQTSVAIRTTDPGDDYPQGNLGGSVSLPVVGAAPNASQMWSRVLYDWLRRGGPAVNVRAVVDMMGDAIAPSYAADDLGFMNAYTFIFDGQNNGWIKKKSLLSQRIYGALSDQQIAAVTQTQSQSPSRGYVFDVAYLDNVYRPGTMSGGKHAGEPIVDTRLNNPQLTSSSVNPPTTGIYGLPRGRFSQFTWNGRYGGYGYWFFKRKLTGPISPPDPPSGGTNLPQPGQPQVNAPTAGDLRPTYVNEGLAAEIAFHKVKFMTPCEIDSFEKTGF